MLEPTMESCPAALEVTATPVMPAAVSALLRAVAYWAMVSPPVTVGATMVAVAPEVVRPVMVRLVDGIDGGHGAAAGAEVVADGGGGQILADVSGDGGVGADDG